MKKYTESLLQQLKERQMIEEYHGMPLVVKNLPDCDEQGAMDPRLYQDTKNGLRMMAWLPKGLLKMDTSEKGIANLRKMFNGVKSVPCTERNIVITKEHVKADDGYEIPVRIYHSETPKRNSPVLYYIHGGGFLGGHPGVVEESVKLFVAKTDSCAVSVDYRLAPENPYPRGHQDCFQVLQWIYAHAEELGGDKQHIFVAGDSAGGNLAQYCTTRDWEDGTHMVRGQLLLYPTLNMAKIEDAYYHPSMDQFEMTRKQRRGLTKMIDLFGSMTDGLEPVLGTKEVENDYLNPYTRDPGKNPPTFVAVGEHDFLKLETLGYAVKLYQAGVDTRAVLYKGFGHAFFDNAGVYPQCEDCVDEMARFVLTH